MSSDDVVNVDHDNEIDLQTVLLSALRNLSLSGRNPSGWRSKGRLWVGVDAMERECQRYGRADIPRHFSVSPKYPWVHRLIAEGLIQRPRARAWITIQHTSMSATTYGKPVLEFDLETLVAQDIISDLREIGDTSEWLESHVMDVNMGGFTTEESPQAQGTRSLYSKKDISVLLPAHSRHEAPQEVGKGQQLRCVILEIFPYPQDS
ncbi:hypothetical protein QWY79_08520 [Halomonas sabkhae]|uniref:hypothetical protein n=1 Tax=Halomonas sabkhae TaxID=626223 RepID=UPI0025B47B19|nr:hypothetical protein [Halomonas sabkhae]MDN3525315.1 hypothetical protein [Halomonas sabkhae]